MATIMAEIERTTRVIVNVDIPAFCASRGDERRRFLGTDEEFVRQFLNQERFDLLGDFLDAQQDEGVEVMGDYDEIEVTILGTPIHRALG